MNTIDGISPAQTFDCSRAVLDLLHQWLTDASGLELVAALEQLADVFDAGVGLAGGLTGAPILSVPASRSPTRLPWRDQGGLLEQIARSPTALTIPGEERTLLVTFLRSGEASWLLWLADRRDRVWSPAEAAALRLAGQTVLDIARGGPDAARLDIAWRQQRLDIAAAVSVRIAHDYGNVLTSLQGFSELALDATPRGLPLRTFVEEVHSSAQNGTRLTSRLRLFGRPGHGSPVPASLHLVASEQARAATPTLQFRLDVPSDLPPAEIDPELLRQVLSALVENASDAMKGEGVITIKAARTDLSQAACLDLYGSPLPGPCLELTVADTGPGLCDETRDRLFVEPFFSVKPRHRGLGLLVVWGILRANRGGFRLEPGTEAGALARVYLPIAGSRPPSGIFR